MTDEAVLWHATFRKEAMDLLAKLWVTLEEGGRNKLAGALLAGPPDTMMARISEGERQSSRDRRIFDRISIIERIGQPALTEGLALKMRELRRRYPEWQALPSERARFGSWMEARSGPDTRFSVDDLSAMNDVELESRLRNDDDRREGLLNSWRQLAAAQPRRAFALLAAIGRSGDLGPADIWQHGLWGLRDAENAGSITDGMLAVLADVPDTLFSTRNILNAAAELIEAKSRIFNKIANVDDFWRLFDRALAAIGEPLPDMLEGGHVVSDWVSLAINRPLGQLATAFVNALFAGRPEVRGRIPDKLRSRADNLMSPRKGNHRVARVIGASRISYLYAIDPEWATATLIPSFSWSNEDEAVAMWQGYAWQARIDPELWAALKPYFLPMFQSERLERLGEWGRNIAQTLMLVGIAFGTDELRRDEVRSAIRAMSPSLRAAAASWIADYLNGASETREGREAEVKSGALGAADRLWMERIWPWLRRVWPTETSGNSAGVAEQFALAAIATDDVFPDAVKSILPFAFEQRSYRILSRLHTSNHPSAHPESTLILIDAFISMDRELLLGRELREIVGRIGTAEDVRSSKKYRQWAAFIDAA